ncbi:M28 family peptidase [Taibaiella chishuiensis]|uniref:Carboxypeptidase Q n=1 Tax=Taibaiella chishuiensis TaxID=1434707 RepID=A0A2P8DDF4_9BACT|nr:M28 family peptidase [Taibaiella chishuiensis]PSK95248.1 peptidase M28-like protein [Taibaiella chishuiensis]
MTRYLLLGSLVVQGLWAHAQIDTNIINNIRQEVANHSQLEMLGQQLADDIGPRLIGSPQLLKANDWLVQTYKSWGITARNEQYGTWPGWERGTTQIMMTAPRVDQLDGIQLAWSPATAKGKPVEADVIALPLLKDSIALQQWLPQVKGKIVLIAQPQISGRPEASWKEFALEADYKNFLARKEKAASAWTEGLKAMGTTYNKIQTQLEAAGAAAIVSSFWTGGWSSNRIFGTKTKKIPHVDMRMEDYQMLWRFTQRGITPRLQVTTTSKHLGPMPAQNTIAEIRSAVNPEQYVMLSAHFDSWDGGTGATDNGTGSILMMEVMRILKQYYPNPKRSIIVGHWGSEEQGLNGSKAFAADHKDMMPKISVLFNQDNGTGRISKLTGLGFLDAYDYFGRWFSYLPDENRDAIETTFPGNPGGRGGSDYAAFVPYDVPAFFLLSNSWDYGMYTWHTTLDTYDKIVWEDMKRNAVTVATLVYLACEEPEMFSRRKAQLPLNVEKGERMKWPEPTEANRTGKDY